MKKILTQAEILEMREIRRVNDLARKMKLAFLKKIRVLFYKTKSNRHCNKIKYSKFQRRCYSADLNERFNRDRAFILSGCNLQQCQYNLTAWRNETHLTRRYDSKQEKSHMDAIDLVFKKIILKNSQLRKRPICVQHVPKKKICAKSNSSIVIKKIKRVSFPDLIVID